MALSHNGSPNCNGYASIKESEAVKAKSPLVAGFLDSIIS